MDIYVSTTFLGDNTKVVDVLDACVDSGILNIEIGSIHLYEPDYSFIERSSQCQFLLHNYFPPPEVPFVLNIASTDERIREASISHIKTSIDFSRKIGARLYTFHPGFLTNPEVSSNTAESYDFSYSSEEISNVVYEDSFQFMVQSIRQVVEYASNRMVPVAIETQGAIKNKDHILMSRPEEYLRLFDLFPPAELGVNLNLAHVYLASNALGIDASEFIDVLSSRVVAMEISHCDGVNDLHLPLQKDDWYWAMIGDKKYQDAFKVLEFRNASVEDVQESINLFLSMI